jgi:hypothetical protein
VAVAFDTVGPSASGASSTSSTTLSWNHTTGSGVALVVWVAVGKSPDTGISISSVKLDPSGANTTIPSLAAAVHPGASTDGFGQLFGLANVSSGAHTITVTVTGGTPVSIEGGSVSYSGADTSSPFGNVQSTTAGSGNPTITYTGSTAGNMVAAGVANGSPVNSVSAGTSRWINNASSSTGAGCAGQADIAAGGSVTITWSTTSDESAVAAVEVKVPQSITAVTSRPSYATHRARPGRFRKGRTFASTRGVISNPVQHVGPPFYPLPHPAGNAARAPGPRRKGRASGNPGAPVSHVPFIGQQVAGTSTYDYGLSTTAITTSAGNTLVVLAGWDLSTTVTSAAMPAVKVTDSAGNYWFHAGTSSSGATGSRSAAWICVNSRPITWVSVSLTTFASSLAYTVLEVVNMPAYYSLDVSAANAVISGASLTVSPGSTARADIAFSVLSAGTSGLAAPATPAGWTALTPVTSGAGSPNPVQIFPFWASALGSGSSANTTYTVAQAVALSGVTLAISATPSSPVMPNPNFPVLKVEAAFGFSPGDPSQAPPTDGGTGAGPGWTDITSRALSKAGEAFISSGMGRQYELSQMEAGELAIAINNQDGAFTPGNTASSFYPSVVLGTQIRVSGFWAGHWYYIGSGWVERWPQEWPDLPQWGMSKMIATDAVSVLSSASMVSALNSDELLDAPYVFIPGSEQYTTLIGGLNPVLTPADAQGLLAANISRTNQRAAVYVDGTAAGCDTGQATGMLGTSDTGFGTTSISTAPTQPSSGPGVIYTDPALPDPASTNGVSVEFWVIIPAATAAALQPIVFSAYGPASNYGSGKPSLTVRINAFSGSTMTITTAAGNTISAPFNPGSSAQQIVLNITASSLAVYLNGGLVGTKSLGATDTTAWNAVSLGCPNYAYEAVLGEIGNFTAFNLAVYPYQLPTQRILSHYVTGFSGQQGSDATARMAQILTWANLGIARAGQVLFGTPGVEEDVAQGPAYSLEGQSAADGINQLVLNESGQAFATPSGAVQFAHRWALFNQGPVATFGDSAAASDGEVPYLPAMSWDYDNTYVYNQTQVTQQIGANSTITVTANDFASQAAYFLRSALTQTIQTTSDLDAYALADWEIAKYSQPELRVTGVTIDAASNAATTFPVVLGVQQGQAVTATRRPAGGAEISELVIVQKIQHTIGPGLWQTSYQLSPYVPESDVLELDATGYDILGNNTLP